MTQDWKKIPFGQAPLQIIDGDRSKTYPTSGDFYDDGHCLFLNATNVTNTGFSFSDCQFISEQKDENLRKGKLSRNDVVLTTRGTLGNVAYYGDAIPFDHVRINSGMVIMRTDPGKLLPAFLYGFLCSPVFKQQVEQFRSGVAQPQLPIRDINRIELSLPSKAVQESIVEVFSTYDDLIENNRRRMKLLEDSARLLYQEWFVRLRFPGHERTRLIKGIPEGWELKTLGEICKEIRETVSPHEIEPETPYIGLEHMPRRSISLTDWSVAETVSSTKHRFIKGDILFGKIRPYFHKVGIAFVAGVASSDAIVIRPNAEDLRSLVLVTVSSDRFVAEASQTMREGSKMPRADWKHMTKNLVLIPPSRLLETFSETITTITNQLQNLCFQNLKLKAARDLLLPRLMSGEIAA